jgi:hypothetical protein
MDSGWGKLEVNVFLVQKLFQGFGTFVVKALEAGLKASGTQFGMDGFVAIKDGGASAIFDGFGKNAVAVIVVAYKQIIVAMAGGQGDKASGLIGVVHLASRFHKHGIAKVCVFVGHWAWGCKIIVGLRSWFGHHFGKALVLF